MSRRQRWPLRAALALVTLGGLAACGSGSPSPAAGGAAAKTPTPARAVDTARATGLRALQDAISATSWVHSYAFTSTQTISGSQATSSTLTGEAVRPSSVSYILGVRGRRTQIVRLATATYLRAVPGSWARLKHPAPALDPAASLLALLHTITNPTIGAAGAMSTIRGVIPTSQAHHAGLPAGSGTAAVTVTVDRQRRVTGVRIDTIVTRAGARPVALAVTIRYSSFDAVPPIRTPR